MTCRLSTSEKAESSHHPGPLAPSLSGSLSLSPPFCLCPIAPSPLNILCLMLFPSFLPSFLLFSSLDIFESFRLSPQLLPLFLFSSSPLLHNFFFSFVFLFLLKSSLQNPPLLIDFCHGLRSVFPPFLSPSLPPNLTRSRDSLSIPFPLWL